MKPTITLQEIRIMKFEDIYTRWQTKKLTIEEAAEILGVHERTFRRQCHRYKEHGMQGLCDARLGKKAHNTVPVNEVLELTTLFETCYADFTAAHFYDKWIDNHGGQHSYSWVKKQLQEAGLIKKSKKKGGHRKKRPRKPLIGMMLHQDGSTHEWVPGVKWDLIVTMDDATNEVYSAFFVVEEGTWSSLQGVMEVIETKGIFCTFYSDRGAHYWYTAEANGKVDKQNLTQFGRAMKELGIEMIPAYSPQARGRSERVFRTWQERLPKELALLNITEMPAANKFLKDVFIANHNKRFMVAATEEGSAFIPWLHNNFNLRDILCIKEERTVNKDNTVQYNNKTLQIPQDVHRYHYLKVHVKVHEYQDGSCAIFYGHRCLAHYDANGKLKTTTLDVTTKEKYV